MFFNRICLELKDYHHDVDDKRQEVKWECVGKFKKEEDSRLFVSKI